MSRKSKKKKNKFCFKGNQRTKMVEMLSRDVEEHRFPLDKMDMALIVIAIIIVMCMLYNSI